MKKIIFGLVIIFFSSCKSTYTIDKEYSNVYINDALHSSDENYAYFEHKSDDRYLLFLWQKGMFFSDNELMIDDESPIVKIENTYYLKDKYNRKYVVSNNMITIYDGETTTVYTDNVI